MKSGMKPGNSFRVAQGPPARNFTRLRARRADLLSLISEMERNSRLQAAPWQIESLRNSLYSIEQRLSRSVRTGEPRWLESLTAKPFHYPGGRIHRVGPAREGSAQ